MSLGGAAFSSCGSAFTHVTSAGVLLLFSVDVEVFVGVIVTGLCSVMHSRSESCSVRCECFLCAVYVSPYVSPYYCISWTEWDHYDTHIVQW